MAIDWEQLGKKNKTSYSSIIIQQQQVLENFKNDNAKNKAEELQAYYNNLLYARKGSSNYKAVEQVFNSIIEEADAAFERKTLGLKSPAKLKEDSKTKLDTLAANIQKAIQQLTIFKNQGLAKNYDSDLKILQSLNKQVIATTKGKINCKTDSDFINNYNEYVVKILSYNYRARTGYVFENLITKLHNQADAYSEKMINKIVAQNIGSEQFGTKAFVDIKGLDQEAQNILLNEGYKLDNKGSKVEFFTKTADKTDIKITLNNADSYFLSLKNYLYPDTNISISGNTRLVALLSSMIIYPEFSTAFMETVWFGGNGTQNRIQAKNVINTAKIMLAALMLTGAGFQNTTADIFVINNRSQRRIYCYSMGEIIEALKQNSGNITIEGLPQVKQFLGLKRSEFTKNFVSLKVSGSLQNLITMMSSKT